VNGQAVKTKRIVADGSQINLVFETKIERSSWVALRILPSSHTNPIWVMVGDQPVRASKRSAEWCAKSLELCWTQKERTYAAGEKPQAGRTTSTPGRSIAGCWPSRRWIDAARDPGHRLQIRHRNSTWPGASGHLLSAP
jgi:hypothetical protein